MPVQYFFLFLYFFAYITSLSFAGYFIQVTDIHLDHKYFAGSTDNCLFRFTGMPCCREYQVPKKPYTRVSKWGSYICDTSPTLLNNTFSWITEQIEEPIDFIINTGDSANHHLTSQTPTTNLLEIRMVQQSLDDHFPDLPKINVLGNHDAFPIDQTITQNIMYPDIAKIWNLSEEQKNTFVHGGFYRHDVSKQLTFIVINSIFFDYHNVEYRYPILRRDYRGQFQWVEEQLQNCSHENRTVWLLNHEPPRYSPNPANHDWYTKKIIEITEKYPNTIAHHFFGHSHEDYFLLFGGGVGFVSPSLLPANHDPAFRLYEYNGTHITDYVQYSTNLTQTIKNNKLHYRPLYRFSEITGGSPQYTTYQQYHTRMYTNDTLYREFCNNYMVGSTKTSCGSKKAFLDSLKF